MLKVFTILVLLRSFTNLITEKMRTNNCSRVIRHALYFYYALVLVFMAHGLGCGVVNLMRCLLSVCVFFQSGDSMFGIHKLKVVDLFIESGKM